MQITKFGKSFVCFFREKKRKCTSCGKMMGEDIKECTKCGSNVPGTVLRKTSSMMPHKCPFCVNFSMIGLAKSRRHQHWKPEVFHVVRITAVNANHTCSPNTVSARFAICKSGNQKFDFKSMQAIVSLLYENPNMTAQQLRPYLTKFLPHYQHVNASYMRNFRSKGKSGLPLMVHVTLPTMTLSCSQTQQQLKRI